MPGSVDSEVSEEQKKEKIADLKKKEKDMQDALAQKLEELKKICMREAVSIPSARAPIVSRMQYSVVSFALGHLLCFRS